MAGAESTSEQRLLWPQETGEKTGWLIKNDEKTMKISGMRCTPCGQIELHAKE